MVCSHWMRTSVGRVGSSRYISQNNEKNGFKMEYAFHYKKSLRKKIYPLKYSNWNQYCHSVNFAGFFFISSRKFNFNGWKNGHPPFPYTYMPRYHSVLIYQYQLRAKFIVIFITDNKGHILQQGMFSSSACAADAQLWCIAWLPAFDWTIANL